MNNRQSVIVNQSEQAMSIKYNTMVYELQRMGKKVLILSLGEAFFDIPLLPMENLPFPDLYHYSNSRGTPELREKLAEFFLNKYDIPINYEKEILITAGSKAAIHFTFMAILNPGDEVIIPEPFWVSYPEQVKLCYGVPISVPYYKSVYDYEDYITEKTKAIIICNPHNPTGYVYKIEEIEYLLGLAKKHNLWILSDEAYSEFVDENDKFVSTAKIDREKKHTIVFNSISKNYGISGWRLGYVISNEELIFNILKINQHIITCPSTILEFYVEKYFYKILEYTNPQIKELIQKRKKIAKYMKSIGLESLPGNATFYFFVSIAPSQLSSEEFCTRLLHELYISTVPGLGYGNSCDKFIRVSVGTATIDEIKDGLLVIKKLIEETSVAESNKAQLNALVVAGGLWQIPLINYLKTKGHKVTVVDPYLHSPGVSIANDHIKCDVRDSESIIEKLKDSTFDFIASDQSDISVNTVSKLNDFFNLPGNTFDVTNKFVNKVEMRILAQKNNIPSPNFAKIFSVEELNDFIDKNGLPIIIKPVDSQSSRGVVKIDSENIDHLEHFVIGSLKHANCGFLIAEEFVEGIEVTVEGFTSNYKHKTLAISKKSHFRTGIASSLEYPANIPEEICIKIEQFTDKFVENSGLRFGIIHAEYIINLKKGTINLIEIACRGGGTLISSDIVNWVSGINVYDLYYANLKGGITDVKHLKVLKRNAILQFFEFCEGKVKGIHGFENAKKIVGVENIALNFKVGDNLLPASDDRSRQGHVIIFANSQNEINEILKEVLETIKIEYE